MGCLLGVVEVTGMFGMVGMLSLASLASSALPLPLVLVGERRNDDSFVVVEFGGPDMDSETCLVLIWRGLPLSTLDVRAVVVLVVLVVLVGTFRSCLLYCNHKMTKWSIAAMVH